MKSKTFKRKAIGGNCDGQYVESTHKPNQFDEFRAGHDLYVYRQGKWRFQKVLLPPRKPANEKSHKG